MPVALLQVGKRPPSLVPLARTGVDEVQAEEYPVDCQPTQVETIVAESGSDRAREGVYPTPTLDDNSFWQKVKSVVMNTGREVIKLVLPLYYCMCDDDTPQWARAVIIGELIYFISPVDAVPDVLPGGYVDDLAVLGAAAATVAAHIKPEHRERAQAWIDNAFRS